MSDWGGYGALAKAAKQEAEASAALPLRDCPQCGEPLDRNPRTGELNCRMGHFRAPAGATRGSYGG